MARYTPLEYSIDDAKDMKNLAQEIIRLATEAQQT